MADSPPGYANQSSMKVRGFWVVCRNLLALCVVLLFLKLQGCSGLAVGALKDVTFSKKKLKQPNPTTFVFHVSAERIRGALPQCTDTPCPPPPTPCLVQNTPTDGTQYDLSQLYRTKSEVYNWFGTPLEYKASYLVTVTSDSDSQTKVDVRTTESTVLLGTKAGIHGGDFIENVAPTTIEEYRYLLWIGSKVGEGGMPPLQLP
jgi:hypothetical protein